MEPLGSAAGQQSASLSLTRKGRDLLDGGRTDEAVAVLEKAIALHSSNPYAYYYMARARFIQSETGQSLALLAKAELYFRDNPSWLSRVFLLRGQIDETLSRPEDARKEYEAALAADPLNQQASERIRSLDSVEYR
jgi:tetratricopeptide (TPR) repeat protein